MEREVWPARRTVILAENQSLKKGPDLIPKKDVLSDEVDDSAPTGRDSIAQGASALGWVAEKNVKPQRGGIPLPVPHRMLERIRSSAACSSVTTMYAHFVSDLFES